MLNNQIYLLTGLIDADTAVVSLLQGFSLPLFLINIDGSIRYTNPAFNQICGFLSNELIGEMPPYSFWPDQPAEFIVSLKKELISREQKLRPSNGADFWVEIRVTPVSNGNDVKYYIAS